LQRPCSVVDAFGRTKSSLNASKRVFAFQRYQ
jgi:hypothetical protein